MEPEGTLPYSQEPAVGSCLDLDNSSPRLHSVLAFLKIQFNIIIPSCLGISSCLFLPCLPGYISHF